MAEIEAGPSDTKIPKLEEERYLMEEELERMLYDSDDNLDDSAMIDADLHDVSFESESDSKEDLCDEIGATSPISSSSDEESQEKPTTVDIDWQETPNLQSLQFCKKSKLLMPIAGDTPLDFFNLLFDETFFNLIVEQTNRYAEEVFLTKGILQHSRISRWRPITKDELKIFLGLFLHMGTIHLVHLSDYWKTDRLFNFQCFSSYMSRNRFLLILRCLHFCQNPGENEAKPRDRLFKIRHLIDYFNKKMHCIYYPDKNLCIDESMVLWRGKLVFKQYIPTKRHKYGVKFYMLTEPSGLILKFAVYAHTFDEYVGRNHASQVVLHLMEDKLNVGHSLYMDNFYNSYDLSVELLSKNTHSTGTLRIERQNSPIDVKMKKLKKAETIARYSNNVMIGKWKEKRDVAYISTEFENALQEFVNKRGDTKFKPLPIIHYNQNMGGVDRQDQFMAYYPCARKTMRWYKKIGLHIVQLLLLNSYLLYKKYFAARMPFYNFRLEIIRHLLPENLKIKKQPTAKILTHFLGYCPRGSSGKTLRKRCKQCSLQGKRTDTPFLCKVCKAGFCLEPCFEQFHIKLSN